MNLSSKFFKCKIFENDKVPKYEYVLLNLVCTLYLDIPSSFNPPGAGSYPN